MSYVKLYFTADDVQVSVSPTTTNAVTFTLAANTNEVGTPIGLYAEADAGYSIATTTITPTGTTATKWALAPDSTGSPGAFEAYGDPLVIGTVTASPHVPFWVKAKAVDTETPVNDVTVTLVVSGTASAV
jgi:hypothetical protein